MHTKIKYPQTDPAEKRAAAIADIRAWVGDERFEKICEGFKARPRVSPEHFTLLLSIAGIAGYPVRALYETIWPEATFNWEFLK